MKKIVDISEFNSVTDWNKLKASCDGVILRAGFRGYGSGNIVFDEKFKKSFEAVKNYKIPFSIYFTTQAINEVEAKEEAGLLTPKTAGADLEGLTVGSLTRNSAQTY